MIVRRNTRIQEKTKEISQSLSKAVISSSRCGRNKLVFEHCDKLISIWVGTANIEPLSFGISSGELHDEHQELFADSDAQEDHTSNGHVNKENDNEPDVDTGNSIQTSASENPRKRNSYPSIVPRLINNKRKHLEKKP